MVMIKGKSIVGIPRDLNIPIIGRIKLSKIYNINQSPILFEYLKGYIYAKKGL